MAGPPERGGHLIEQEIRSGTTPRSVSRCLRCGVSAADSAVPCRGDSGIESTP